MSAGSFVRCYTLLVVIDRVRDCNGECLISNMTDCLCVSVMKCVIIFKFNHQCIEVSRHELLVSDVFTVQVRR